MKSYQITRNSSNLSNSKYDHLYITVKSDISDNFDKNVTFTWQGNPGESHWYACRVEVRSEYQETFALAAKLMKKINIRFGTQPQEVINHLNEMKYKLVTHHKGLQELYPVDKWPEGSTWTCKAVGTNQRLAYVVAKTEYDAKRKFRQEAAKAIQIHSSGMKDWIGWLDSGMVVLETYPDHKPEFIDLELTPKTTTELAS